MGMLFGLIFIGPISWFYHPQVHDAYGNCIAQPGSYRALWCPATDHVGPMKPSIELPIRKHHKRSR